MSIYLGNLTIKQIEDRSGVKFPDELVSFMSSRHQSSASEVAVGEWHCFDIPFTLMCGDMATAEEIYRHLEPMASSFAEPLQIALREKNEARNP